ncbi:MAG: RNase H family protein [Verrucomicrobiota bacterium]|jgi:ribonuclease HI
MKRIAEIIPNDNSTSVAISQVEIYTDGGCEPNPGLGGYGLVLLHPKKRAQASDGFRLTTNNRMETCQVEEAKRFVEPPSSLF